MTVEKRLNFTKKAIERLPLPDKGRVYWYDTECRGLTVCVWSTGAKNWILYRRVNGRPEREKLGSWPEITVEQARKAAEILKARAHQGDNPSEQRRRVAGAPTFEVAYLEFLDAPTRTREKRPRSPITRKNYKVLFDAHLKSWHDNKLTAITKELVERLHNSIGKTRPYLANRVLSLVKAVLEHAVERKYIDTNPATRIRPFAETQRERFLQATELPRFFAAVEAEPNEKIRDFVMVALLTGQRRTNVLTMAWNDVDLDAATWRIPNTKSQKPLTVPLVAEVVEILRRRQDARESCPFVFPGRHGYDHLRDPMKQWREILERADLPGLRIHDLRRTLGSWQAATGASLTTIGKSLGHSQPATTAIYARLELSPVRAAVNTATTAMLALKPAKEGDQ